MRGKGGGKPEKLRTKEIKLMSFLEGASVLRRIYQCVGDGGGGGRACTGWMLCFAGGWLIDEAAVV